jgi:hypothetical protein
MGMEGIDYLESFKGSKRTLFGLCRSFWLGDVSENGESRWRNRSGNIIASNEVRRFIIANIRNETSK